MPQQRDGLLIVGNGTREPRGVADYLAEDDATKVILVYLEEITDGAALLEAARTVLRETGKPILAIKSGRTSEGGSSTPGCSRFSDTHGASAHSARSKCLCPADDATCPQHRELQLAARSGERSARAD